MEKSIVIPCCFLCRVASSSSDTSLLLTKPASDELSLFDRLIFAAILPSEHAVKDYL